MTISGNSFEFFIFTQIFAGLELTIITSPYSLAANNANEINNRYFNFFIVLYFYIYNQLNRYLNMPKGFFDKNNYFFLPVGFSGKRL